MPGNMYLKECHTVFPSVAPVEAVVCDVVDGLVAGSVEELLLVVLVPVPLLHPLFLDLKTLPKGRVLDPLNLGGGVQPSVSK